MAAFAFFAVFSDGVERSAVDSGVLSEQSRLAVVYSGWGAALYFGYDSFRKKKEMESLYLASVRFGGGRISLDGNLSGDLSLKEVWFTKMWKKWESEPSGFGSCF